MDFQALGLNWDFNPGAIFLNHGSFGLAPRELLQWRFALLNRIERDPVAFLTEELASGLQASRAALARLVGAEASQLAFVPSTTYGLNELLLGLELPAGSEVLISEHGYNATRNLARFVCDQRGWSLRDVPLPLPVHEPREVVEAFAAAWGPQTRLLLLDHITSPSALVLPIAPLAVLARDRGAKLIVDGAHAPGSLPLDLNALGVDGYVGNLHKWLCCPRGSAFLWVAPPWQERLRPLVISHGANGPLPAGVSRFQLEHDWIGTADPTPWLALPQALSLLGGGDGSNLARLARHRALALAGEACLRQSLLEVFPTEPPGPLAPPEMAAAMAALRLPGTARLDGAELQRLLRLEGFQLPVLPLQPHRQEVPQFLRISCFAYNDRADLEALAAVLPGLLRRSLR